MDERFRPNNKSSDTNSTNHEIGVSSMPCSFDLPHAVAVLIRLERCTGLHNASLHQVTTDEEENDFENASELDMIQLESDPTLKAKMMKLYNKTKHLPVELRSANRQIA